MNEVKYTPNNIPLFERVLYSILSLGLLIYGTLGVIIDDLYIPGKRTKGMHFHGEPALVMYIAFLCAVLNLMSVVIDHYDKRNNERNYRLFSRISQVSGWIFFGLALVVDIFVFHKST